MQRGEVRASGSDRSERVTLEIAIMVGVLIMTAIGEPVRRFRLKRTEIRQVISGT